MLCFTIGVEIAQLTVVLLVLPVLLLLATTRFYPWFRRSIGAFSAVASLAWMAAIFTGSDTVLAPVFALISANPVPAYVAFVSLAVGAWAASRPAVRTRPAAPGGGVRPGGRAVIAVT